MKKQTQMTRLHDTGLSKYLPLIDINQCSGCGDCIKVCGPECLDLMANMAVLTDPQHCGSDAHCVLVCSQDAIRMEWLPYDGPRTSGQFSHVDVLTHKGPFVEFF